MDSIFCHGAITASARAEWAQLDDLGPAFGAWISLSGSGSSSGRRGEWKFPGECTLCSSAAIRMSVPILEAHHPALFVCDGALSLAGAVDRRGDGRTGWGRKAGA